MLYESTNGSRLPDVDRGNEGLTGYTEVSNDTVVTGFSSCRGRFTPAVMVYCS
jgi:hypothetical protein